jgi:hypothetical protein
MLVLFGDSYVSEPKPPSEPKSPEYPKSANHSPWFKMLADDLGIEYKTYGESGSSFEYSTLKFFEYLTGNDYNPSDYIVFVLTRNDRSPVVAREFPPKWAALTSQKIYPEYLDAGLRQQINKLTDSDEHYTRFKQFYRDWYLLQNQDLILAQRYMLLRTLHNLPNKTVSISVDYSEASIATHFPKHANFSLLHVNNDEISDGGIREYARKYGTEDFRLNHLHEKNHHVLKDALYACLTDDNFSDFNGSSFHKNLFSIK